MASLAPFTFAVANIEQPDTTADNLATVDQMLAAIQPGGVVAFNEAAESVVKRHLLDQPDAGVHQFNELAICWDSRAWDLIDSGHARVMVGGFKGAGTSALDRRRRGPDRYVLTAVLRQKASGSVLIAWAHHAIAKRTTTATWREPLAQQGFSALVKVLAEVRAEHPDAQMIGGGDLNGPTFVLPGCRWLNVPATYPTQKPSRKYDHIAASAGLDLGAAQTIRTKADHLAVLTNVTAKQAAPPPMKERPVSRLPANLPSLLRSEGLTVIEHDGWSTRGRPSGGFAPVGVLCHHTATSKASSDDNVVRLLINGRSDLPGPLCHMGLDRQGRVHMIAAGRANHAGKARATGSVAAGDGNSLYIGIEAFNDGVGEKWPAAQYSAYVTLAAALTKHVTRNSVQTVRGHKESSVTGKIDPTFDMDDFREAVQRRLNGAKVAPAAPAAPAYNHVQKGRAALHRALTELRKANPNPDDPARPAVARMVARIEAAMKSAPTK